MKLIVIIVCLALLSVAVLARDLSSIARKERARRQTIHSSGGHSRTFTNTDLDAYPGDGVAYAPTRTRNRTRAPSRDLQKEESYWRQQTLRHERELARLDASIRRLEWRLSERQTRSRARGRLREDPSVSMIEESLESLREQREDMKMDFQERARKAGAFPGWLR